MKKSKKTISLVITLAMLLSMLVMPQHASAATFPLGENFDSWTSETLTDDSKGSWISRLSGVNAEGVPADKATLTLVDGDNALELNTAAQLLFWIGDAGAASKNDTNSYKLSYSFKSNGGRLVSWLAPWRNGYDPNLSHAGSLPLVNAGCGTATLGRQSMDDGMTLGAYTVGEAADWYKVEAILDYSSRLCKVYFKDANGDLIGTRTTAMDSSAYAHRLVLSNWNVSGGSVYVDDISMEETDERVTVLTYEDFENVADWTELKKGPFTAYQGQSGWTGLDGMIQNITSDGVTTKAATPRGVTTDVKGGFDWYAGEALTSGTWKISLKFYTDQLVTVYSGLGLTSNECNWNKRQGFMGTVNTHNGKGTNGRKFTAFGTPEPKRDSVISDIATGEWYDYEAIIDLDNKVAHATLFRDGKKIGGRRDFSLAGSAIENGFDRLGFTSWSDPSYFIDDLKVEKILDYKETIDDYVIYSEDFDDMVTEDLAKDGWVFSIPTNGVGTIENGALKLDAVNNTNAEKWMTNTNPNTSIKVKYDVLINEESYCLLTDVIGTGSTQNSSWFVEGTPVSSYIHGTGVYGMSTYYHNHYKISDSQAGKWITVENVMNFKDDLTGTVVTTVKDRDTGVLLNAGAMGNPATFNLKNSTAQDSTTVGTTNFQTLRFRNWSTATPYIDNIVVSEYYDEPALDESKVTLTDIEGNAAADFQNVTPAIDTITLNFGAEMDSTSAMNNITLTDASGNNVGFTGAVVDKTYVLTLTDALTAETEYTLKVNKEVESTLGVTLGRNFEFTFTTAKATCSVGKAELYSGTDKLDNVSGLAAGATVTVKTTASNSYAESKDAVIIIGYYNGNTLVNVALEPVTIPAGAVTPISEEFTLPDMTDVTTVDVFIWDTTSSMIPYCDVLSLMK